MPLSECACVWEGQVENPKLVSGCTAHLMWRNECTAKARSEEREACAKLLMDRHDELQISLAAGARPMASMLTGTLREVVEEVIASARPPWLDEDVHRDQQITGFK